MKKILLFAVALALPLLFSCKKDNKDTGSAGIPTGSSFNSAATFNAGNMWASFNGDKNFLAGTTPLKSLPENSLVWGTYEYENGKYTMYEGNSKTPWATLQVVNETTVTLTIGSDSPQTLTVSVTKPSAGNENQRAANHTWNVESLTVIYKSATFNGLDLNAFETFAKVQKPIFQPNMVLDKVALSDAVVCIVFKNGQKFVAQIPSGADYSKFTLTQLKVTGVDEIPIFEGVASIAFTFGKCVISVNGSYEGEPASAILTLSL